MFLMQKKKDLFSNNIYTN